MISATRRHRHTEPAAIAFMNDGIYPDPDEWGKEDDQQLALQLGTNLCTQGIIDTHRSEQPYPVNSVVLASRDTTVARDVGCTSR